MDEVLRHVKRKGLNNETLDQINHERLHENSCLPLELVGETERSRTDTFDTENSKSQFKWTLYFPKVEERGPKLMKTWN